MIGMSNSFKLPTQLVHENIQTILSEALAKLSVQQGAWTIDCSDLIEFDSSALSLIAEMLRQASQQETTVRFDQVPEKLRSLAKVYGVTELILS
jgi:phospholipid transport system transporter-binding protein